MAIRARREVDPANSEQLIWHVPYDYRHDATKPAVVYCHVRGGSELEAIDYSSAGGYTSKPIYAMVNAGYPVVAPNLGGGTTWGNDTAITRVGQAKTFAQNASPVGAKAGGIFVAGSSMGFLAACNWARQNVATCLGVIGFIFANDMNLLHTNNVNGAALEMETAYGGNAAWTAALPTHNPQSYATTDLAAVPMLLTYSTDESETGVSSSQASFAASMQAATTSTAEVHTQAGGHSFVNFNDAPLGAFLRKFG